MSQSRTEVLEINDSEQIGNTNQKPRFSLKGFFGLKTSSGSPWPNPPSVTITSNENEDKKNNTKDDKCCCFPFRRK